ncbi:MULTISPECIES: sn-glycerol-3-phosphate import ATP-binding protein UgpC [Ensifer]|uniref:Sn-glycerol-3-phosphate import ATP-binding protein UgpC n=1 Tax=Ensifer adhaerens TaxID=106592 RepID=A0ABY8HGW3_ENSAD|nr:MULTISPECIES: sn-glycerol-3-phosphate import ATP-binding protein UgpC [Ensifer]ANK74588.1 glycerol-3-phosphate transporter ATP-binding subunit [Ensifer adhaerens]KDP70616.1 glycerol-3-phosphate transporter ATP-binding subunit [Ensifer adhaerens]KQX04842.1 glycerol-3-phosphate transporter ATP-binding subunit [Ensifer sp. Root423]KQZ51380.1 glycerol-3-phosphate transporter ATP-binding subunit [Ensifer sp. Root558]MBD9492569.1 sn-glycerol-3-phosphate import ATP-binding protein UgpC [Ensifer sp
MAAITIAEVSKIYHGNVEAVKSVSIDIEDGEFIVLVGPSGCGKSTLLRMVAGLETISKGTVTIGSRVINEVDPAERDIAMVFQNYALYPHMTVYENLAYGLKNRKTPKAEIDARVAEAARMLEIEPYLTRKPRALSGGQRQRVAMGRAIVRKPAAFLFDEPLSNLDAKLRVSMRGEIKRLQKRLGTTSLYVTHDQLEAMTLADRLVVLNGGRIEQIGRPLDVYHRPASTFVASFIGSPAMNLIKGVIEGGNLQIGLYRIALGDRAPVEGPVTVGLRAEDLKLAGVGEDAMLFQVDYVEELGAQRLVHGTIESQALTIALSPETPLSGDLAVTIAVDRLHFFSTETGKRLERGTSFANEAPVAAPRLETAS